MAKAAKSGAKRGRPPITVELPKGFRAITGGGDFAPSWDYVKQREITGAVVKFGEVPSRFKKGETQKNLTVKTASGEYTIWESAGTRPFFDPANKVKKGTKIHCTFTGLLKIKGRKEPMKQFLCGIA